MHAQFCRFCEQDRWIHSLHYSTLLIFPDFKIVHTVCVGSNCCHYLHPVQTGYVRCIFYSHRKFAISTYIRLRKVRFGSWKARIGHLDPDSKFVPIILVIPTLFQEKDYTCEWRYELRTNRLIKELRDLKFHDPAN